MVQKKSYTLKDFKTDLSYFVSISAFIFIAWLSYCFAYYLVK